MHNYYKILNKNVYKMKKIFFSYSYLKHLNYWMLLIMLMSAHCIFTDSTLNLFASKLSCGVVVRNFPATFHQVEPMTTIGGILTLYSLSGVGVVCHELLFLFTLDCGFELVLIMFFNVELVFAFTSIFS